MARPTAIGCHVYSGGFAVGVSQYFDIQAHVEELDAGLGVFQDNFPSVPLYLADPTKWPLARYRDVDLFYGNPPCAPWSQAAGGRYGGLTDPRLAYTFNTAQAALTVRPKVFVFESVSKIATRGKEVVDELTDRFHRAGYNVTHFITDAALHGAPQWRERFHFVAHLVPFEDPKFKGERSELTTTWDAISDLADIEPDGRVEGHDWYEADRSMRPLLSHMRPGEDGYQAWKRLANSSHPELLAGPKPSMLYKRIRRDSPSNTVVAVHRLVHPTLPRMCTVREAARLLTYPDWFTFRRSTKRRWPHDPSQAVTPTMGSTIAEVAARGIASGRGVERNPETIETPWVADEVIDLRPLALGYKTQFRREWQDANRHRAGI